ncbi:MAG: ANTAR domain-containing protein [Actinomycetota bacterium]
MDISPVQEAVEKLARSVLGEVDGADAVSITLMEHETIETTYSTDPACVDVDHVQYSNGTGPCIDAMRTGRIKRTDALEDEERWPEYAQAALKEGFTAVLAAPLELSGVSVGALNLYSRSVGPFPETAESAAQAYAVQVSYAIDYAKMYEQAALTVDQLEEALKSRAVIDQAMGILMEREGVGSAEAFEMLRTASQHSNVKLREIARRIVEGKEEAAKTG